SFGQRTPTIAPTKLELSRASTSEGGLADVKHGGVGANAGYALHQFGRIHEQRTSPRSRQMRHGGYGEGRSPTTSRRRSLHALRPAWGSRPRTPAGLDSGGDVCHA